jgi:hypothetical protein
MVAGYSPACWAGHTRAAAKGDEIAPQEMPDEQNSDRLSRTDRELLLSLREQIKYLTKSVAESIADLKTDLTNLFKAPEGPVWDHEQRIRRLENFRWWILGAIAAAAGLSSLITKLLP